MIEFWLKLILLLVVVFNDCELIIKLNHRKHTLPSDEGRIFNGRRVHISEVPFVVQLLKKRSSAKIFCTGFLISRNKVVTASHCIYDAISEK